MIKRESPKASLLSSIKGNLPFGALKGSADLMSYSIPAIRKYVSILQQKGLKFGMPQVRSNW